MIKNRKCKSSNILFILVILSMFLCVHNQNTINRIWLGVDNNLRTNVKD
jgi:hypothetical protein